jgi:NAD(P)-dependent dehydrogenase (short-subunit alcohol dehydrogenase family)
MNMATASISRLSEMPHADDSTRYTLLTGASRGIGHATVKLFQEHNWKVFTVSRQPFSEDCKWPAARESHIQADLADLNSVEKIAEEVSRRLPDGKLHTLVNNAGISPKGEDRTRLGVLKSDTRTWSTVLNVNLISNALLARALFPELGRATGAIVNVTSIAGFKVHPFAGAAYAVSKAALFALTREMAHEFGPEGVRVNAIAPERLILRSCRQAPKRSSTMRFHFIDWVTLARWRRQSISFAGQRRPISMAPRFTSTEGSTSDLPGNRAVVNDVAIQSRLSAMFRPSCWKSTSTTSTAACSR